MTLAELKINRKGRVMRLRMDRLSELHEILAMGVVPGVEIILRQKFPSFIFQIGQSRFAIDRELAEDIEVGYCEDN